MRIPAQALVFFAVISGVSLAACGGGGGGGGSAAAGGGSGVTPQSSTVSGDMIGYQTSRGWTYHGSAPGLGGAVTISVYADPVQNGVEPLIGFAVAGTTATAFSGEKVGGVGLESTSNGTLAASYVLLNADGSLYADGAVPGTPMLVPSSLTQGQSFSTYPGVTALVESVGTVPGESACPSPTNGATVSYTYQGQAYHVSYVPGCGITNYVGNHGETFTLVTVGTYALGTQSVHHLGSLSLIDDLKSAAHLLVHPVKWTPFPVRVP